MYQKTLFTIVYLLTFVGLISGCSIFRPESETMPLIDQETILPDESGDHVVAESVTCFLEERIGDKLLKIDAVVELPEVSDLATVSLAYDVEKL